MGGSPGGGASAGASVSGFGPWGSSLRDVVTVSAAGTMAGS